MIDLERLPMTYFIDKNGCVFFYSSAGDGSPDYGDSAANTGRYYAFKFWSTKDEVEINMTKIKFTQAFASFYQSDGSFHRAPDYRLLEKKWRMTRDQVMPLFVAAIAMDLKESFKIIFKRYRRGFAESYDIFGPHHWSIFLRGFDIKILRPVIFFLDIGFLFEVLIRIFKAAKNPDDCGDDLNLSLMLALTYYVNDTFFSRLARKIYARFSVNSGPFNNRISGHPIYSRWAWYYRKNGDLGAAAPIDLTAHSEIVKIF